MKKLFLFISLFISGMCFGQSVSQRSNGTSTVNDPRLMATINLVIPRYADTTAANVQKGIDSCGAIIFTYADSGKVYVRKCFPVKYWAAIGSGGGGGSGGFLTANNGLTASTATNVQWGGTLIQATTISASGNTVTFDSVGTFVVNRNAIARINIASTSTTISSSNTNNKLLMTTGNITLGSASTGTMDLFSQWVDLNGNGGIIGLKDSIRISPGASQVLKIYPLLNNTNNTALTVATYDTTDGSVYHTPMSAINGINIYNSDGTTSGARAINLGGTITWSGHNTRTIAFDSVNTFTVTRNNVSRINIASTSTTISSSNANNALSLTTAAVSLGSASTGTATVNSASTSVTGSGGQINLFDSIAIRPGASKVLHIYPLLNNTNNPALTIATYDTTNASVYHTPMSAIVGATPTLQQVLTAGSSITASPTQTITGTGSNGLSFTSFDSYSFSAAGNSHFGGGGTYNFDDNLNVNLLLQLNGILGSHNAVDSMLVWNSSTKYVGYRPIPSGTGTVTSVGFTGGLISVANPTTTPAFTVAGTSGGIPYFSSTTTWASSALLTANAIMIGGGAGTAPATTTTGTGVLTALGINVGSAGAFVTFNGALGTPSSGTLTNATGFILNNIANPTGDWTPTFDVGESITFTNSNTTEDLLTINTSTLTTASLFSLNSTSTALASGNNVAEFVMSGANGSSSITATAIRASVTNSGTTNTNIAIDATATGGATDNWAVNATGNIKITTANTTQVTTSAGLNVNANSLTNGTAVYIVSSTLQAGTLAQIVSTSTALAANNEGLDIAISGANGTNAITATGIRSTVTNTNGTSGTNVAASFTASGATTANIALQTGGGNVLIGSPTNNTVDGVIIQSPTNTAGQGLRIYANNNSTYTELGYGAILNPGGFAIQSSSATVINLVGTTTYIGAATTATSTLGTLSFAPGYVAKTANYTATISDFTINCTANTFTVTLPASTSIIGRIYYIINSGAGTITISTSGGETFLNVTATPTTLSMATVGATGVQATGGGWVRLSSL